jgi:sugar O-acyltransferase (sialic acid O-acetyltransferase NeuD family)
MKKLYIVGAGGFGREAYAWASQHPDCGQRWEIDGFLDDNADALAAYGRFARIHPLTGHLVLPGNLYVCGLGKPDMKEKLLAPLLAAGAEFPPFIDPSVRLGSRVRLGRGVVLCPGAIITTDVTIGDFVLINLNSTVGHEASVGDWSTLSAQCDVTGGAKIADRVFMGSRATVIPGKSVGSRTVVAAGAVVMTDVPADVIVAGNPARVL